MVGVVDVVLVVWSGPVLIDPVLPEPTEEADVVSAPVSWRRLPEEGTESVGVCSTVKSISSPSVIELGPPRLELVMLIGSGGMVTKTDWRA